MQTAHYFEWGWILITIPNLIVVGLMILVFLAALFVQLPGHGDHA